MVKYLDKIKQELENLSKLESPVFNKFEAKQFSKAQAKNQSNQMNATETGVNLTDIIQVKDECDQKLMPEADVNQNGIVNDYTQANSRSYIDNQPMIKLINECDLIFTKYSKNNQDIMKLMKIAEDFRAYYYSNTDKNEFGEEYDWFEELSNLSHVKKEKIKLFIKVGTRLNMLQDLADTKQYKEAFKFLDLYIIGDMSNLDWKILFGKLIVICKKYD